MQTAADRAESWDYGVTKKTMPNIPNGTWNAKRCDARK